MRAVRQCFFQMILFIKRDMMLFAACFTPLLAGSFFKFVIPWAEVKLTKWRGVSSVLASYDGLFDILFTMLTPLMFCFIAAMVILEETDDHIARYLYITPLGMKGYLKARFGVPAVMAFIITVLLLPAFKLTDLSFISAVVWAAAGTCQGVIIALMIVSLASNKLEGMAITKLSSITILGVIVPYFISDNIQYVLTILPSFWIGKAVYENNLSYMFAGFVLSVAWILILIRVFIRKVS